MGIPLNVVRPSVKMRLRCILEKVYFVCPLAAKCSECVCYHRTIFFHSYRKGSKSQQQKNFIIGAELQYSWHSSDHCYGIPHGVHVYSTVQETLNIYQYQLYSVKTICWGNKFLGVLLYFACLHFKSLQHCHVVILKPDVKMWRHTFSYQPLCLRHPPKHTHTHMHTGRASLSGSLLFWKLVLSIPQKRCELVYPYIWHNGPSDLQAIIWHLRHKMRLQHVVQHIHHFLHFVHYIGSRCRRGTLLKLSTSHSFQVNNT